MTTSAAVRQKLVEALSLDLVGPDATLTTITKMKSSPKLRANGI